VSHLRYEYITIKCLQLPDGVLPYCIMWNWLTEHDKYASLLAKWWKHDGFGEGATIETCSPWMTALEDLVHVYDLCSSGRRTGPGNGQ
jgi:hypothetical protein